MGKEKSVERKIITELEKQGLAAWHMDCSVDGFPDILAMGKGLFFLVEVKQGKLSMKLSTAFQSSQPVWMRKVEESGFHNVFDVLFSEGSYHLYAFKDLWREVLSGKRFSDFPSIIETPDVRTLVEKIMEVSKWPDQSI